MNSSRFLILLVMGALLSAVVPAQAVRRRAPVPPRVVGAWELVWPDPGPDRRVIKLITATHFSWTAFDPATHAVFGTAGGPYVLEGDSYQEQLAFASGYVAGIAGTVQAFRVRVEGDTLRQMRPGDAPDRSVEVWRRLR